MRISTETVIEITSRKSGRNGGSGTKIVVMMARMAATKRMSRFRPIHSASLIIVVQALRCGRKALDPVHVREDFGHRLVEGRGDRLPHVDGAVQRAGQVLPLHDRDA